MKIEKIRISYSTTIPIMSYGVNDKIGVEMELSPESGQFDLEHIVTEHKSNVDAIVKKLYPQFYQDAESKSGAWSLPLPAQEISSQNAEERRIGDIENDIKSCTDLRILETYRFIAKSKPEFQKTYDEQYTKLSNQ